MQNVIQATRRAFLAKAPFAAAAIATPAVAIAATETARARVDRLATELSHALAEFENGDWHARVFAAYQPYAALQLRLDNFREPQEDKVRRIARVLQFEMTKLPPIHFDASGPCYDLDYQGGDVSMVRLRLAAKHSEKENILIGFISPLGPPAFEPREV
jgi:hypothetical protein